MADMNPFSSVFTVAHMILDAGFKVTIDKLNELANNTGFNWLGGRHPMRESFGVLTIPTASLSGFASTSDRNPEPGDPIREEIEIASRQRGVHQFSRSDSYQVFATMASPVSIQYSSVRAGSEDEDVNVLENLLSLDVISQTPDSFTIQFDLPSPAFFGALTNLNIAWFAKGW